MGFAAGMVAFRRFFVSGKQPKAPSQDLLDRLEALQLRPAELGVPEESEYGWCGGRHILDAVFSFENNVYADCIFFALRIDTNRVPPELKKAYEQMEEGALAAGNPSGHPSKKQRQEARDSVRTKLEDELRSGRFRRSKLVPILWDLQEKVLYSPASSKAIEKLAELFERTFDLQLEADSAGASAARALQGRHRDYEDMRPTRFVQSEAGEGQFPEYPWTAKGDQPKDFLGNEFFLWLWCELERLDGVVATERGQIQLAMERALDLDCAYGITGRDLLKADAPARMPEARDALTSGKVPRRMTWLMEAAGVGFQLSLQAETFAFSAVKFPDIEDAESARVVFEERIALLRELCHAADALYAAFLKLRASSAWESQTGSIRKWIGVRK